MAYEGTAQVFAAGDPTGFRNVEPQWPRAAEFCEVAKSLIGSGSVGKPSAGQDAFEVRVYGAKDQRHHAILRGRFPGAEFDIVDGGEKWFVPYCAAQGTTKFRSAATVIGVSIVLFILVRLLRRFAPFALMEL